MISLVLAESSLELVPEELQDHPSVLSHARKLGKSPSEILLDNSWHFAAMKGIDDEIKRGRPDLVHFSILEATTIPLYLHNKIKIYVHTIDDKVIYIGENVHIPKSYHRFEGLIEKLFLEKVILSNTTTLMEVKKKSFSELINEIKPSKIIGFSTKGQLKSFEKINSEISDDTCIVIGGFQKGHFSESIKSKINHLFSVGNISYEAHVVIARMLYEYEKTVFM
ncbi:ribosome biogenesis protein [Candidatus Nitrosarchaeum limnium SFB1]|jgi:rRNA small subunit pseudouridine methyltransferase Nep1|uniref:Ribosomal RNA small subunit methyltransferase Nep1 n=1 Tax=Candidatus Nitrosarchaeum limnium SFB1 TaxID=886738 RepID=F3KLK6_9ARCH|nr:ribosome biogenesis protein [Candidatus Nitrosarchaeum limnium SFB1]